MRNNHNEFIQQPTDDIAMNIDRIYSISKGIVQVGIEDYQSVISGANNIIILEGKGLGRNRVCNALEDAVLHTCQTAPGYDLFSAETVIVKLIYPKDMPLMMDEMRSIMDFSEMFKGNPTFIWGVSESVCLQSDVVALVVASNLTKKYENGSEI